jgi:hypothetical protein
MKNVEIRNCVGVPSDVKSGGRWKIRISLINPFIYEIIKNKNEKLYLLLIFILIL